MRVRTILWYHTEGAIFVDNYYVLSMRSDRWRPYGFFYHLSYVYIREEFEKEYLEWKARNED